MAARQTHLRQQPNSRGLNSMGSYTREFPDLSTQNPKYLTLSATDVVKPISFYSCFAVHRAIKLISPEIVSISSLRNGSLLILVKNTAIADKFVQAKELIGVCGISCKLKEAMNCVKGTIYAPYLINVPDTEILAELRSQQVTAVYKFGSMTNGIQRPTGKILLTFERHALPHNIDISWNSERVMPYEPYPMRCRNCQLLGHTTKRCLKRAACCGCNLPPHGPLKCIRTQCANCKQGHPASSPACLHYQRLKEILRIKSRNNCSMREARIFHGRQELANRSAVTNRPPVGNKIHDFSFGVPASQSSYGVPFRVSSTSSSSFDPNYPSTGNDSKLSSNLSPSDTLI